LCSYEALVDGLRQGPSSFANLIYHSQVAYEFLPQDGRPRAARFRLIPRRDDDVDDVNGGDEGGCNESGTLSDSQQHDVATCGRRRGDSRPVDYLRQEFIDRLQRDEPVTYQLQIQLNNRPDMPCVWNPQLVRSTHYSLSVQSYSQFSRLQLVRDSLPRSVVNGAKSFHILYRHLYRLQDRHTVKTAMATHRGSERWV